ncbi:hypothetical protein BYT27DRAFT_7176126 [Phlegmacium glaucopus]|nr:hypothetical protein BYT27DRAFT_7176126 [Phlegmacium glaucopus]
MCSESKTTGERQASHSPEKDVRVAKRVTTLSSASSSAIDPALLLLSDRTRTRPPKWDEFRHILVFGGSYCSETKTNWIGHLQKRIHSTEGPPCVHGFAKAGDTVEDDLSSQMRHLYSKFPSAKSLENSDKALFIFWMGINDCGRTDADELEPIVEQIFDAMHDLCIKWKARYFLLIDLPPMQRSPGGIFMNIDAERYNTWNTQLLEQATSFANSASKASVFVVSAHHIISDMLNHPEEFGLSNSSGSGGSQQSLGGDNINDDDDNDDEAQEIWEDDIHLSSAAHRVFADRLLKIFDCR